MGAPTLGGGSTATPNAVAIVTTLPNSTLHAGTTVAASSIALAIAIGAAVASGQPPDPNPVTVTVRDAGHTITVRVIGASMSLRDGGHTITAREQREPH
jgi:hypothetical protein